MVSSGNIRTAPSQARELFSSCAATKAIDIVSRLGFESRRQFLVPRGQAEDGQAGCDAPLVWTSCRHEPLITVSSEAKPYH